MWYYSLLALLVVIPSSAFSPFISTQENPPVRSELCDVNFARILGIIEVEGTPPDDVDAWTRPGLRLRSNKPDINFVSDAEVNNLMWRSLGYTYVGSAPFDFGAVTVSGSDWDNVNVFKKWVEKYPIPPDFIGMRRNYAKEFDEESLRSVQSLIRTIPLEHKQGFCLTLGMPVKKLG